MSTIMNAGEAWEKIAPILHIDYEDFPLYLGKDVGIVITLNNSGVHIEYKGFRVVEETLKEIK